MKVPFTPQLLGDLIEKGYTYMLASVAFDTAATGRLPVVLRPVKQEPVLTSLPDDYQTFYRITREPLQMLAGIDGTEILLDYDTLPDTTNNDVYDDSYFRMSEDFFRQVLDSLEDYAIVTTDIAGNVNSWNTGAEKLLGFAEQEILGLSADVFFTPEDREKGVPEMELNNALTDGRAIDERYHMRKDGSRFWGTGLVFPLYDESRKHRGFTKIMRNLREEENARHQADNI